MRFFEKVGEYLSKHWIRLLASIVYCIVICVIYNLANDGFGYAVAYSNGLFIGGATLFLFGLLTIVNYFGGFDIFSYMFRSKYIGDHRESLYEYSERKKIERKPAAFIFIDYLVVGTIFMIVSFIILLIVG